MTDLPQPGGWLRSSSTLPLAEVYGSVPVAKAIGFRRFFAFLGPGFLVAVGYMDPGNWATSIAGGSQFGYTLLSVALLSNLIAMLLQALCARLGIATGRDLAMSCRDAFPRPAAFMLWVLAEAAIVATDLAEVIGTAIGLQLLFGLPLSWGVIITACDVFLILALQRIGFRWVEAFVVTLLLIIAACFLGQILLVDPVWSDVAAGFLPNRQVVEDPRMLYLALGILGATVMPHNLYLHSAVVQTRAYGKTEPEKKSAIRMAVTDSTFALFFALFINAAILILAAAGFHATGRFDVEELGDAHQLLTLLGASAPIMFAVALLCCGLNSTVTATMAGQAVMEGFIRLRLAPWARRLITRLIAIVPAAGVILISGEAATGKLLILSQVVLSLQLPFAVVPLVMFTASRAKMGNLVAPKWMSVLAALAAALIIGLNIKMLVDLL